MPLALSFLDGPLPQKKFVWLTDLHLDAADSNGRKQLVNAIAKKCPDALFVGGDLCNGVNALKILLALAEVVDKRIYFVLGNHDFYYGSIEAIRQAAKFYSEEYRNLFYLTGRGVFPLAPGCALVGHDGWSDARAGDWEKSDVIVYDYMHIKELKDLSKEERRKRLHRLGYQAAEETKRDLCAAFDVSERVILLCHPPPFIEACFYKEKCGDPIWTPHFVCYSMGEMLMELMPQFPDKQLLVLCGHSHHGGDIQPLPNMRVVVGKSELGKPSIAGILQV